MLTAEHPRPSIRKDNIHSASLEQERPTFSTSVTLDTHALGLLDLAPADHAAKPHSIYALARDRIVSHGIRLAESLDADQQREAGDAGVFIFDVAVPEDGFEGVETDEDKRMATRAFVTEQVIGAMGLEDKIVTMENWGGRKFFLPNEEVFPPSKLGQEFSTTVMDEYRANIKGGHVLDVGTGSGILAVSAGLMGADRVTATDPNPAALTAARVSWALNGLDPDRLQTSDADSLAKLGDQQFDAIIANPPVQPFLETNDEGDRDNWVAWNEGGSQGNEVLLDVIREGAQRLHSEGIILTTTSSRHGHNQTRELLAGLMDTGEISGWDTIASQETRLNTEQYGNYFDFWRQAEEHDGDRRIWEHDGDHYHQFMVLRVDRGLQRDRARQTVHPSMQAVI